MRNLFFTLLFVAISGTAFSQSKKVDNATKWITEEMTKVLSLSESEASEMAEIHREKFVALYALNENLSSDEKKMSQNKIYREAQAKMKEVIGNERLQQWFTYQKEKKNK